MSTLSEQLQILRDQGVRAASFTFDGSLASVEFYPPVPEVPNLSEELKRMVGHEDYAALTREERERANEALWFAHTGGAG